MVQVTVHALGLHAVGRVAAVHVLQIGLVHGVHGVAAHAEVRAGRGRDALVRDQPRRERQHEAADDDGGDDEQYPAGSRHMHGWEALRCLGKNEL